MVSSSLPLEESAGQTTEHVAAEFACASAMIDEENGAGGVSSRSSPLPGTDALDSVAILEAFLLEMNELDQQQQERKADVGQDSQHQEWEGEAAEVAPPPQKKTKTRGVKGPTPRKNLSWRRRKQELQSLREQTQAMETHVGYLQLREQLRVDAVANLSEEQKRWRAVAIGEKQQRQEAQGENTRLKVQVQSYLHKTQALQTVLTAAQAQRKDLIMNSVVMARSLQAQIETGNLLQRGCSNVFNMLESRVNARFLEIGAVFQELQLPMAAANSDQVQICRKGDGGISESVKFTRARLLPFDEGATSNLVWDLVELGGMPSGQRSLVTRPSKDMIALIYRHVVTLECGETVNLDVHVVTKRFESPLGLVVLAESSSEWSSPFEASTTWSHTTQETACFMVRGYSVEGATTTGDVTPRMCQVASVLRLQSSEPADVESAGHFSMEASSCTTNKFLIPSVREIINMRYQFMENALFDSTRCRR
ncbi:hypothetical protein BBJ28_00016521 [Nothophytophthora sp. Chile5]|nr:hypothetical protein BBJ28_00016521 [Nothophytophthora sp. Chile5]